MMYRCDECGELFEEDQIETQKDYFECGEGTACYTRNVSPCCHESYSEAIPCAICGEYSEDEDFENDVCPDCLEQGIEDHFMQYLNDGDEDLKRDFYLGPAFHNGGYGFTTSELIEICEREYNEWLHCEFADRLEIYAAWNQFIEDSDPDHFAEWLLKKREAERNAVQNAASQDS